MKLLRFGVIGLGFGSHYLRVLREMTGVQIGAVSSQSLLSFNKVKNLIPKKVEYYQDAEKLIKAPTVDCIVIASPPSTHLSYIRLALQHKKHVLVEKPAVISRKEDTILQSLVRKSQTCFMVGHIYLYNDYIRYLKRYIQRGQLGNIRYAYFELAVFGPIRSDAECFWEIGSHHLSLFDYLFGEIKIKDIQGRKAVITKRRGGDFISVDLLCADGMVFHFMLSWYFPKKRKRFILVGTHGMADYDDMAFDRKLSIYQEPYPTNVPEFSYYFDIEKVNKPLVPRIYVRDPLRNELEHFVSCVRNGKQPITGIEESSRVTRLLDTISQHIV